MGSSDNVHTPRPFELNGWWKFFPELAYRQGEPDPEPFGPFRVVGDYEIKKEGEPEQRFLLLRPPEKSKLQAHNRYTVECPEGLISGDFITFERKAGAQRIRVQISPPKPGVLKWLRLKLKDHTLPIREYVLYEEQVEGTWIPIEADGDALRP